ncbi:CD209 antigen-like protein E isoform X2 [Varanus komodoensis]|uniref:CD209 antigen-like protein E isoform X2 n=1 Tax=Varanus komodoensis TaxID=61221 RepID=UPI001CF7CA69|nr:CD209 antigen-like protein E isoform X2 [Varanus komodoensis]
MALPCLYRNYMFATAPALPPRPASLNKLDDDYDDGGMVIPMAQASQWKKEETLKTLPVEESRDTDNQKAPSFSAPAQAKIHSSLCIIILFVLVIISLAMSVGVLSWFLMKNVTPSEELQGLHLNNSEMLARVKEDLDDLKAAQSMHERTIKDRFSELQDMTVSLCEKSNVSSPCPTKWTAEGKMCYFFSKQKYNWNDAFSYCTSRRAHLVSIWSDEEAAFLIANLDKSAKYWLGLTYLAKEKKWQWKDDDQSLSISFWNKGEPQKGGNKNCAIMHPNGTWASAMCSLPYHWICKKRLIC